jgi:hypothetical protein
VIDLAHLFRRGIGKLLLTFALLLNPWTVLAEDQCEDPGVVFGFFNGVQTTEDAAQEALQRHIAPLYGPTTPAGHPITYDLFYNDTEGLADFAETFDQRLREHDAVLTDRFELFFAVVKGDRGGWWGALTEAVPAAAKLFSDLLETVMAKALQQLTRTLGDPSLAAVSQRHRAQIDRWAAQDRKLLLFAHSQGNLFVNAAHAHSLTKTDTASVRVVHVAPASPTLAGRHTLADKDFVINGLRATGLVAPITDIVPGYASRPAGLNGRRDLLGHGLLEMYLNAKLSTSTRLATDVNHALTELDTAPRKPWPPYPDFLSSPWQGGEPPAIQRLPDEFSHMIDQVVVETTTPDYWRWNGDEWQWQGEDIDWDNLGYRLARRTYSGKGISGFSQCIRDIDRGTYGGEPFVYTECSYHDVPSFPAAAYISSDRWPRELSAIANPVLNARVGLLVQTYRFHAYANLAPGKVLEGQVEFYSGSESRWTNDMQDEQIRIEPYWRKGGAITNQSEVDAWHAAYQAHDAAVSADYQRYLEGYRDYERRRQQCGP